jgi:MOSC domain-containing protein YiiM
MHGTLAQVNVSNGGIPKLPVLVARVTPAGLDGDLQRNRKYHGGPDRAVCIYSEELYAWLNEQGVRVANGAVGENFTTRGVDLLSSGRGTACGSAATAGASSRSPRCGCRAAS